MRWRCLLVPLVLAAAIFSAHAQDSPALPMPSQDSAPESLPLSSYDTSALWMLYFQTLGALDEQLTQDRQNLQAYSDYMALLLDNLTMQMLESRNTARRASLALTAAKQALIDSEQSARLSRQEAQKALKAASAWRAGTFIAGGLAAVLLAGLCIALAGK